MAEPLPRPEPTSFSAVPVVEEKSKQDQKKEIHATTVASKESSETVVQEEAGEEEGLSEKVKVLRKKIEEVGNVKEEEAFKDGKLRERWYQLWRFKNPAPPVPTTYDEAGVLPLATCSMFSYLTYSWCNPIMTLGYQRPLQPTDLWQMDPTRQASLLSANLDASWSRRQKEAQAYNSDLAAGRIPVPLSLRIKWSLGGGGGGGGSREEKERSWRAGEGRKEPSLGWAIVEQFRLFYGLAVVFKVFGDTCQLMSPILAKAIIVYAQETYSAKAAGTPLPSKGRGVGMALGMYLLTMCWSVLQHQVWWRGMTTGVLMRAALTCSVYKRALVLSNNSRAVYSNGKLMNHLSTDISRIDYCAMWAPSIPSSIPQIVICTLLLCLQIGPSALAGIAFFFIIIPLQSWTMQLSIKVRMNSMTYTDQRSKILQELLGAMRVIKYFTFERPYAKKIDDLRAAELRGIRTLLMIRATNTAVAFSLPVISAVIALCCYIGLGNELDPAKVFTAISLFQLLRQPLMLLPTALSAATDAYAACHRLTGLYEAETMDTTLSTDSSQKEALVVDGAEFEWVGLPEETEEEKTKKEKKKPSSLETQDFVASDPFRIRDLSLSIEKGSLVAICGPVGSGKSSLLQGLIGEMKRVSGTVTFNGRVAYCPQSAWIMNATVRENILFGRPFDEARYWKVVEEACLLPDYEMLPSGDMTEIGEKGINLSGGQKQRCNIARALYFDADVILFDDPLSAVDAHVGRSLFQGAIVNGLRARGKTIILVTHALHFLPFVDRVLTLENGVVVEDGTYDELVVNQGPFSRLMKEFGGAAEEEDEEEKEAEAEAIEGIDSKMEKKRDGLTRMMSVQEVVEVDEKREDEVRQQETEEAEVARKVEGKLILDEKRETGTIKSSVYSTFSKAGYGNVLIPSILLLCVLMQGSQTLGSYWIVWWQADHWNRSAGFYMALYAALGITQALMTLVLGLTMAFFNFYASRNLHKNAVHRVFFAPSSFFDTVPLGRIMGVFGKDFDTIDNILPESLRNVVMTVSNVIGSIILITVFEYYFIIAAIFVIVGYVYFQRYYQKSGRELKRIDSMLRSLLYSHFSESLSGLATIRAYGEAERFVKENELRMDVEDRAYILYTTTQRWLAIRLDAIGSLLILAVALLVSVGSSGISPSQTGLLLTYTVSLVQMFGMLTRQTAEVENNMNGAERITSYTDHAVPQEAAYEREDTQPPPSWPEAGQIEMKDVFMSYRAGLPSVLKGINLSIKGGEKIGVVGRTGAGKSSIMSALFRLVELSSGSISVDGVDISTIGLRNLRESIVIIPQDPLLFSGTIRSNLDPFSVYDDIRLWDAMKRAHLVGSESESTDDASPEERFSLDTVIEEEGNNLSVGQRSLVSLARALVREEARIVILDECTAAVDLETDSKIQQTIRTELKEKTLLCIAHRLRTIIFYDRILVLDGGRVAEFDTPLALFSDENSIFHSMCVKSSISADEIARANA
ncbi:ABC protein [Mrakia frigida]|uniref:ABC protein n=1 Tax=Mrakia frigida TaxID=29902 RepID=UPI003FCBF271